MIHASPPTKRAKMPSGEELEMKDDTVTDIGDHKKRRVAER